MGGVGGLRRDGDFRVGGDLELAGSWPEFVIVTRRTSASSSAETTTSKVVCNSPSCREKEARSSLKSTS